MLIFRHQYDLRQLQINTPIHHYLQGLLERAGELEGCFILIEENDRFIQLPELQANLRCGMRGSYHRI